MKQKKIRGKLYNENGPFYCPNGCSWDEIEQHTRSFLKDNISVITIKVPIKENLVNKNTHEVWLYTKVPL